MDVQSNAALFALAAKLRLNAANGNIVNGSTPGASLQRSRPVPSASAAGSARGASAAYRASSAPAAPQRQLPAGFSQLKLDLPELIEHLSNAKELYTAYSVVSKTANQMYGTMLDILEEGGIDDVEDYSEIESGAIGEAEVERQLESLEIEAMNGGNEMEQVADASLDAHG